MSKSRTYRISLQATSSEPILLERGQPYRFAQGFLDHMERAWKRFGRRVERDRTSVTLGSEEFSIRVWIEEEKDNGEE